MQLVDRPITAKPQSLAKVKSFLVWTFALSVCLLVVGFPLVVLMATVSVLLAITLHPILPVSTVLLVAGGAILVNSVAVLATALVLTLKGIAPEDVSWLSWLHGDEQPQTTKVYAACPLTCSLEN